MCGSDSARGADAIEIGGPELPDLARERRRRRPQQRVSRPRTHQKRPVPRPTRTLRARAAIGFPAVAAAAVFAAATTATAAAAQSRGGRRDPRLVARSAAAAAAAAAAATNVRASLGDGVRAERRALAGDEAARTVRGSPSPPNGIARSSTFKPQRWAYAM